MTGYAMSLGCECCGCQILEHRFFPDFYDPVEVICFVRRRERKTVATLTTQTTRTWVNGVGTNSTVTLANKTETTDETTDSVATLNRAGQFEWIFPTVTVPFPAQVVESETGEVEVNGTRVFVARTQTITNRTVWEEYRLVMRFDVSEQPNFDRLDELGARLIKAATASVTAVQYVIDGWAAAAATGQTLSVSMRGLLADAEMPEDREEFNSLWSASSANNITLGVGTANSNVLPWLPTVQTNDLYLLFYSDTAKRGLTITGIKLAIWDRMPTVTAYDWSKDWKREGLGKWRSLHPMPADNYQFSLSTLLPITFWNQPNRQLIVTLFSTDVVDNIEIENVLMQQTLSVELATEPETFMGEVLMPLRWPLTLVSEGSFGRVPHLTDSSSTSSYPTTRPPGFGPLFNGFAPVFKVRGSVIEMSGPRRDEAGLDARYEFIPFWQGLEQLPSHYLRIEIVADYPEGNIYTETGLQHFDDDKKMTCPGNYTCSVIDDYSHPEWRIISHSLTGLNDDRTPTRIDHVACRVSGNTPQRFEPFEFFYTRVSHEAISHAQYISDRDPGPAFVREPLVYLLSPTQSITPVTTYYRSITTTDPDPGEQDNPNQSGYLFAVTIHRGYNSLICSGLPNENTFLPRPVHLHQTILVASGVGVGLVFRIAGVHTFIPNAIEALAVAKFTFELSTQAVVPTLESLPTLDAISQISAVLGSSVYWFQYAGNFYSIDSTGALSEPLDECGIDPPELVDVVGSYTPVFRRSDAIDAVEDDAVEIGGVEFVSMTGGQLVTGDDVEMFGEHTYPNILDFTDPSAPDREYTLESVQFFSRKSTTVLRMTNGAYGGIRPILMFKRVARWHDREMPTITFTGEDCLTPFNYRTGTFTHQILRKIDRFSTRPLEGSYLTFQKTTAGIGSLAHILPGAVGVVPVVEAESYSNLVDAHTLVAHVTTLDLDDLSITIGPSTYVPPDAA